METTALGAAYLAGLDVGFWSSIDEIKEHKEEDDKFIPDMDDSDRQRLLSEWNVAVEATKTFKI